MTNLLLEHYTLLNKSINIFVAFVTLLFAMLCALVSIVNIEVTF